MRFASAGRLPEALISGSGNGGSITDDADLTLYATPDSPVCEYVERLLDDRDRSYRTQYVSRFPVERDELQGLSGQSGVPVLVVRDGDDERVHVGETAIWDYVVAGEPPGEAGQPPVAASGSATVADSPSTAADKPAPATGTGPSAGVCGATVPDAQFPYFHHWEPYNDGPTSFGGGVCCRRPTWGDADRCVWHADAEATDKTGADVVAAVAAGDDVPWSVDDDVRPGDVDGRTIDDAADPSDATVSVAAQRLDGADLRGLTLRGDVSFERCSLCAADLSGADLSGADLSSAALRWADLSDATLLHADLSDVTAPLASFADADVVDATLRAAFLRWADFTDADLSECDLRGASLRGADFAAANLQSADLRDAYVEKVVLSSANLRNADLRYAQLDETKAEQVWLDSDTAFGERCGYELAADWVAAGGDPDALAAVSGEHPPELSVAPVAAARSARSLPARLHSWAARAWGYRSDRVVRRVGERLADVEDERLADVEDERLADVEDERLADEETEQLPHEQQAVAASPPALTTGDLLESARRCYSTYQRLLAARSVEGERAEEFHVREKHATRKLHRLRGNRTGWARLTVSRWLMRYGTSVGRVLGWSALIVVVAAVAYSITGLDGSTAAGDPLSPRGFLDSLYFSVVTFTTLGYGSILPSSSLSQVVAIVEALSGSVMLALLVYVLGRQTE